MLQYKHNKERAKAMHELMTKANINQYLIDFIGIDDEEVSRMPHYNKIDLVEDDMDTFLDYIQGE